MILHSVPLKTQVQKSFNIFICLNDEAVSKLEMLLLTWDLILSTFMQEPDSIHVVRPRDVNESHFSVLVYV